MLTFEPPEKKSKKLTYTIFVVFLTISIIFLYIMEKFGKDPLFIERTVKNSLDLKLSSKDIIDLGNSFDTDKWISVKLIERNQSLHSVKIKHKPETSLDFQLNIDGIVYNLFKHEASRKYIFDFFKTAGKWGINSTVPQLVRLRINQVPFGIYIMEKKIYKKIRDDRGNYYICLGSNIESLKTVLYLIPKTNGKILGRYFNDKKLTSYFVFFSLFCYEEILDFDQLLFFYDAKKKKYIPFLSIECVLSSLESQKKEFLIHIGEKNNYFSGITNENVKNLLARAEGYKYKDLIRVVLKD